MAILCAFLVVPSRITVTMFSGKSTSSSRSLSTDNGPWGSFLEREVNPYLLPRGVFNGKMVVVGVEAVVLLFYTCFDVLALALGLRPR